MAVPQLIMPTPCGVTDNSSLGVKAASFLCGRNSRPSIPCNKSLFITEKNIDLLFPSTHVHPEEGKKNPCSSSLSNPSPDQLAECCQNNFYQFNENVTSEHSASSLSPDGLSLDMPHTPNPFMTHCPNLLMAQPLASASTVTTPKEGKNRTIQKRQLPTEGRPTDCKKRPPRLMPPNMSKQCQNRSASRTYRQRKKHKQQILQLEIIKEEEIKLKNMAKLKSLAIKFEQYKKRLTSLPLIINGNRLKLTFI